MPKYHSYRLTDDHDKKVLDIYIKRLNAFQEDASARNRDSSPTRVAVVHEAIELLWDKEFGSK